MGRGSMTAGANIKQQVSSSSSAPDALQQSDAVVSVLVASWQVEGVARSDTGCAKVIRSFDTASAGEESSVAQLSAYQP